MYNISHEFYIALKHVNKPACWCDRVLSMQTELYDMNDVINYDKYIKYLYLNEVYY